MFGDNGKAPIKMSARHSAGRCRLILRHDSLCGHRAAPERQRNGVLGVVDDFPRFVVARLARAFSKFTQAFLGVRTRHVADGKGELIIGGASCYDHCDGGFGLSPGIAGACATQQQGEGG